MKITLSDKAFCWLYTLHVFMVTWHIAVYYENYAFRQSLLLTLYTTCFHDNQTDSCILWKLRFQTKPSIDLIYILPVIMTVGGLLWKLRFQKNQSVRFIEFTEENCAFSRTWGLVFSTVVLLSVRAQAQCSRRNSKLVTDFRNVSFCWL